MENFFKLIQPRLTAQSAHEQVIKKISSHMVECQSRDPVTRALNPKLFNQLRLRKYPMKISRDIFQKANKTHLICKIH